MGNRAYKFRVYPTPGQSRLIERTFGCCRWAYNQAVSLRREARKEGRRAPTVHELVTSIPRWKKERPWLAEVDSMALQQSLRDFGRAVENRRRDGRWKEPSLKSKRAGRQSYRTNSNGGGVRVVEPEPACGNRGFVRLPKLGLVPARISRAPQGRILSATVERTASGRYFVSILCERVEPKAWPVPEGAPAVTGVDAGVASMMVTSEGEVHENPKAGYKLERRLAREQRRLSRKKGAREGERMSKNYRKQRRKVARVHERIADARRDAVQKATTSVVRESQAVAVEDLNVAGMLKNRSLARATADASMGSVVRELERKCAEHGRAFVKVGRFYASTQTCSSCGAKTGPSGMEGLGTRVWTCPVCGAAHDRDVNAARNIAAEGARLLGLDGTAGRAGTQAAYVA